MKNKVYWTIIASHQMFKTVIEVPVIIDNRVFGRAEQLRKFHWKILDYKYNVILIVISENEK